MWSIYLSILIIGLISVTIAYAVIANKLHDLNREKCKYGNVNAGSSIKVYKK